MKKLIIVGFSAALLAGGVSSCKKTSKGKMANEWTVSAFSSESNSIYQSGDKNNSVETLSGTTMNTVDTYTPVSGTATVTNSSVVVDEYSFVIEKDGTWSHVYNTTFSGVDSSYNTLTFQYDVYNVERVYTSNDAGVWNFIGKASTEDFKKNERVIFNTLESESKTVETIENTAPTTTSNSNSYSAGDEVIIYTVVESKSKELELLSEYEYISTYTDGTTYTSNVTSTIGLSQK